MGTSNTTIRCGNCNRVLSEEERPCPSCGSDKRNRILIASERISITERLSLTTIKEFYERNRKIKWVVTTLSLLTIVISVISSIGLFASDATARVAIGIIGTLFALLIWLIPPSVTKIREKERREIR